MILVLAQYSLMGDRPRHGWRRQESWISRPDCRGCAGRAAGAVSVKMEDVPKLLKITDSECPDIWIRLPRHKWPKSWSRMGDPAGPLERNLYGHRPAGLLRERQPEKILARLGEGVQLGTLIRTP